MEFDKEFLERVRKTAEECSDAKRILKSLIPEAFGPKVKPEAGQHWRAVREFIESEVYIICKIKDDMFALVNINSGVTHSGLAPSPDKVFSEIENFEYIPNWTNIR